jgi:hypothetical protein
MACFSPNRIAKRLNLHQKREKKAACKDRTTLRYLTFPGDSG